MAGLITAIFIGLLTSCQQESQDSSVSSAKRRHNASGSKATKSDSTHASTDKKDSLDAATSLPTQPPPPSSATATDAAEDQLDALPTGATATATDQDQLDAQTAAGSSAIFNAYASLAMVNFVNRQLGQQVGNGQCTELAAKALNAIGVKGNYPVIGSDGSYRWGRHIVKLNASSLGYDFDKIRPGHILQLEGVSAAGLQASHHTQVVVANLGRGLITVNEQNMSGQMFVTQRNWDLDTIEAGTVDVWLPSLE